MPNGKSLKGKVYSHIIPETKKWPIYILGQRRAEYVDELRAYTRSIILDKYGDKLKIVLRRTAYQERARIKNQPWKADPSSDRSFWKKVQTAVSKMEDDGAPNEDYQTKLDILDRILHRYSEEIVGNFKLKTFYFARKFLTAFFSGIFNAANGNIFGNKRRLQEKLRVAGEVERLRTLFPKGTVVVLPTHFSNLDSILIGYAIDSIIGIPAFTYGAGLNLYDSEIVGYFMNRLGAYRVDRRKKNPLYIETLKSMNSLSLRQGVNGLFFPGGTRSRSGALETDLKQGLLNSLVEAQRVIFEEDKEHRIIVVPFVFNYHFTLEADSLITQHLNQIGKDDFVRVRDEYKSNTKIIKFIWQLLKRKSEIFLSVGQPMDVLGNPLNDDAESLDSKGKTLDLKSYFISDGKISKHAQREKMYTRHLSSKVVETFHSYAMALSSHIVAFCAFKYLQGMYPQEDIFGIIRLSEDDFEFPEDKLLRLIDLLRTRLLDMNRQGEIMLSWNETHSAVDLLNEGLSNLGVYHVSRPLRRDEEGRIVSESFKTLYYYHNRLSTYELEDALTEESTVKP